MSAREEDALAASRVNVHIGRWSTTQTMVDELERAHAASTPGEWKIRRHPLDLARGFVQAPRLKATDPYDIEVLGEDITLYPTRDADMTFVVAAHAAVPALVAEVRSMRRLMDAMVERMNALDREADASRAALRSAFTAGWNAGGLERSRAGSFAGMNVPDDAAVARKIAAQVAADQ